MFYYMAKINVGHPKNNIILDIYVDMLEEWIARLRSHSSTFLKLNVMQNILRMRPFIAFALTVKRSSQCI